VANDKDKDASISILSMDDPLPVSSEHDSSDAECVVTDSEESAMDEYDVYPVEDELPSNVMSSDSDSEASDVDEGLYPLSSAESAPSESIVRSSLSGEPESTLEPLNLAFATWCWTHGISVDAFNSLQQLLHSDLFDTVSPFLRSSKGIR
jgi:hypothetical protein